MVEQKVVDYFDYLGRQHGLDAQGLPEHIKRCIEFGKTDFWNAHDWKFRNRSVVLTVGATTEPLSLPDDFDGMLTTIRRDSNDGNQITQKSKEEFDRLYPNPAGYQRGVPSVFTIYAEDGGWRLQTFPIATSGTKLYLYIESSGEGDIASIPPKFVGLLIVAIEKYFYKLASPERRHAQVFFAEETERLAALDKTYKGSPSKMLDGTEDYVATERIWM